MNVEYCHFIQEKVDRKNDSCTYRCNRGKVKLNAPSKCLAELQSLIKNQSRLL